MAKARIIDYYSVLAVPPTADLTGIQNAYARLTDEIARLIGEDDTIQEGILRLNEAYSVLSNPETRRKYDAYYYSGDRVVAARRREAFVRRRTWMARGLVMALALVVTVQVGVLGYLGRDHVAEAASAVLGPLFPDSAG